MAQNPKGTITSIQRLLGTAIDSPFAQGEISRLTAQVAKTAAGGVAAAIEYGPSDDNGDLPRIELPFESLAGMLFSSFLQIASEEYKSPVRDCVITVPGYYTDCQRRAVLAAAQIGNVKVLRVVNEHAAIAFSYGIFRAPELPDSTPIKVAFVDMGDASTTVFIASFTKAGAVINSVAFEPNLGGRDFDATIATVFNSQFKETYGIDALSKPRPKLRLLKESEKVKRVLSANAQAPLNIECLMDDKDVAAKMTRDDFELLAQPLLEKLKNCCSRAIASAKLAADEKLFSVEIVGASCRVPAVKKLVSDVFSPLGASLKTTLNMDECIARGAALIAAGLSPAFSVRSYSMTDIISYAIDAEKVFASSGEAGNKVIQIVPHLSTVPCTKSLSFKPRGPLEIVLRYRDDADLLQSTSSTAICSYRIDAPDDLEAGVKAIIKVNSNGVVEVPSAVLSKEVEVLEDVPTPAAPATKGTNDVDSSASPDVKENGEANGVDKEEDTPAPETKTDEVIGTGDSPTPMSDGGDASKEEVAPMETESAIDATKDETKGEIPAEPTVTVKRVVKKRQQEKVAVTLVSVFGNGLTAEEIALAVDEEGKMKAADAYIRERSEALNGLEGYVYDLRSRIDEYGDLKEYGPEEVRIPLKKELDEAEEWIYSEEGEKANKSTFNDRKAVLVAKAAPMLNRKREREERPAAISALEAALESYKKLAVPTAEEYAHIAQPEKEKALKCVESAALWLKDASEKQNSLALHVDPSLTCAAISAKQSEVDTLCGPIERTPKPVPPKEDPKVAEAKSADSKDAAENNGQKEPVATKENGDPVDAGMPGSKTTAPSDSPTADCVDAPAGADAMETS